MKKLIFYFFLFNLLLSCHILLNANGELLQTPVPPEQQLNLANNTKTSSPNESLKESASTSPKRQPNLAIKTKGFSSSESSNGTSSTPEQRQRAQEIKSQKLVTQIDPVKQAAWEKAKVQAAQKIERFENAVKSGKPERISKAALNLQSDPLAVQKLNNSSRQDLVDAHNNVTERIKKNTRENIKENMVNEWNKAHPNDKITKSDVTTYEPTNYKDPNAPKKVGQDWDVTVRVKGKDVVGDMAQKVVEKSYYDGAGGEKTFGNRGNNTPQQAATSAAHKQSVEVTHGKSVEAYDEATKILGTKDVPPNPGDRLKNPEQLTKTIEAKSNISKNKATEIRETAASEATKKTSTTKQAKILEKAEIAAVKQDIEQMRQAAKQYEKISKPRVEAAGGKINNTLDENMKIFDDVGKGNISPEEARAKLAAKGETPESIINKAAGQVEAAQTLKPPVKKIPEPTVKPSAPEPTVKPSASGKGTSTSSLKTGAAKALNAAGEVMVAVDILSTAQDVKEDIKKGDYQGAAKKAAESGANMATLGVYGTVKSTDEKLGDLSAAQNDIDYANKKYEELYESQAKKKLIAAGVSNDEVDKIMGAKSKGDSSALESKFEELGIKPPEKFVEKAPGWLDSDDTVKERAIAVGQGFVDSGEKAKTFVKETAQDVGEIAVGMTEKGVATEVYNDTKEKISDAYGAYKDNMYAENTLEDAKQSMIDRLIAKGATLEGAKKAADAMFNDNDPSKLQRLNELLNAKKGILPKEAKQNVLSPATSEIPNIGQGLTSISDIKSIKDSITNIDPNAINSENGTKKLANNPDVSMEPTSPKSLINTNEKSPTASLTTMIENFNNSKMPSISQTIQDFLDKYPSKDGQYDEETKQQIIKIYLDAIAKGHKLANGMTLEEGLKKLMENYDKGGRMFTGVFAPPTGGVFTTIENSTIINTVEGSSEATGKSKINTGISAVNAKVEDSYIENTGDVEAVAKENSRINTGVSINQSTVQRSFISTRTEGKVEAVNNSTINTGLSANNSEIKDSNITSEVEGTFTARDNSTLNAGVQANNTKLTNATISNTVQGANTTVKSRSTVNQGTKLNKDDNEQPAPELQFNFGK